MRYHAALLVLALLSAPSPAVAQRDAVAAELSPGAAGDAFGRALIDVCLPAVAGEGVTSLAPARRGLLSPTQDLVTRRQAGAQAEETVWDVNAARGVVTVREKPGQCVVSVYGPGASPVIMELAAELERDHRFEPLVRAEAAGRPLSLALVRSEAGGTLLVELEGSHPGVEGHQSRFDVATARVLTRR